MKQEGLVLMRTVPWWRQRRSILLVLASGLTAVGYAAEYLPLGFPETVARGLYALAIALGGYYPLRSAWNSLRRRVVSINTLLVLATIGAVALGLWDEAAVLVVVFSLGEVLETYATEKARRAMRVLVALMPTEATVVRDGREVRVSTTQVGVGEAVRVRPGEKIPLDGIVIAGASAVDQSPITGESIPVEKMPGAQLYAGTLNGRGSLDIRTTKAARDTTIARIIRLVQEAQRNKGAAQRFSERFGQVYTPAMFVLAIVVATVPPLLFEQPVELWFYRALVVLVVSCSCALVLSVPVAVVAGITTAARRGVLVKGGVYIETVGRVRTVAFDKTGTLTQGRPEVTDVVPTQGTSEEELLTLAAALEVRSEHSLAEAILRAAEARELRLPEVTAFTSITGRGVRGEVAGLPALMGSPRWLEEEGLSTGRLQPSLERLQAEGKTVVLVSRGSQLLGAIAVADRPRPEAQRAVARLKAAGIKHVVMLTGDNRATAEAVGRMVGVAEIRAELLPEDKIAVVRELKARYGTVAMVGDGINDAPALAEADVGIAMGIAGTDVALETADIVLVSDDLEHVAEVVEISRRTVANIRQNIALSLVTIAVLISAALGGWMRLTTGLILNEGSALLIIGNGLRLLQGSNRKPLSQEPAVQEFGHLSQRLTKSPR